MKQLCQVARNLSFVEIDDKLVPAVEVILSFVEPQYVSAIGGPEQRQVVTDTRFHCSPDMLRSVCKSLEAYADDADESLAKLLETIRK